MEKHEQRLGRFTTTDGEVLTKQSVSSRARCLDNPNCIAMKLVRGERILVIRWLEICCPKRGVKEQHRSTLGGRQQFLAN